MQSESVSDYLIMLIFVIGSICVMRLTYLHTPIEYSDAMPPGNDWAEAPEAQEWGPILL
jgi:hypothetical protein